MYSEQIPAADGLKGPRATADNIWGKPDRVELNLWYNGNKGRQFATHCRISYLMSSWSNTVFIDSSYNTGYFFCRIISTIITTWNIYACLIIFISDPFGFFSRYSYQLALYSLARFCDKRISSYNRLSYNLQFIFRCNPTVTIYTSLPKFFLNCKWKSSKQNEKLLKSLTAADARGRRTRAMVVFRV